MRECTFAEAVREGTELCLAADPSVYLMGLGVPDPGGIFGTTTGLREKFGADRVMDMPIAENGMTGVAIGSALAGMRPIVTHQRIDFMLLGMEQLVNQAAKWHYTCNGKMRVPLVIRAVVGRGWGQGPQHSQSLHSWFAHIPGLKTVAPFSPADAKGLLIAAVRDDNPVVIIEHRWLHNVRGAVPEGMYETPLGKARVVREGSDATILAVSHMVYESLRAARLLEEAGVSAEVVDVATLRPLDTKTILASVNKTGRVVAADPDWGFCGFSAELLALVCERSFSRLKAAPVRVAWPEHSLPVAPALSEGFYPGMRHVAAAVMKTLGRAEPEEWGKIQADAPHDVPDLSFTGPF